jgi:large subunit ribosomal protein L15
MIWHRHPVPARPANASVAVSAPDGAKRPVEAPRVKTVDRAAERGFTNVFKKTYAVINIRDLAKMERGSVVDEAALVRAGLVKGRRDGVKLLGQGDIDIPLTVKIDLISQSARQKIESAGGTVEVAQL